MGSVLRKFTQGVGYGRNMCSTMYDMRVCLGHRPAGLYYIHYCASGPICLWFDPPPVALERLAVVQLHKQHDYRLGQPMGRQRKSCG